MQVTVLAQNLYTALSTIGRIPLKGNLPILENVLIEAKEGRIHFTVTNLEMGITTVIGGKVEEEGAVTVSLRLLTEFINAVQGEKISFSLKNENIVVKTERSQASLTTIAAAEFPPFPKADKKRFSLSYSDIQTIARCVAYSASSDEGRPVLTGILVQPSEKSVTMAATDGFRLSVVRFPLSLSAFGSCIIPARAFLEVARIVGEQKKGKEDEKRNEEIVTVSYAQGGGQLLFSIGEVDVFSRLIEGEFPNFEKIFPTSATTTVIVEKELMLRGVKAAAIFARESANIVRFGIKKGVVVISANTPQIGEEKTEIEATVEGEENEIAFNYRFLIEFLASSTEEEITFQMTTPLAPGLFRPTKELAYTHIIMPVRVQG